METDKAQAKREQVRQLNDHFRCYGSGRGSIMMTAGINDQGLQFAAAALNEVRGFDQFTKDNDPYREHDFGAFMLEGQRLFFKIDYYDLDLAMGSPDPANPAVTHRVLTIMLASEY